MNEATNKAGVKGAHANKGEPQSREAADKPRSREENPEKERLQTKEEISIERKDCKRKERRPKSGLLGHATPGLSCQQMFGMGPCSGMT